MLGTFAHTAQAQTNVTIYGIVDEYLDFGHNGKNSVPRLQSGGVNGSRIGFKGTEDLGGGLNAIFTLENGFNADDGSLGQGGLLFGRQAFIGVNGNFGTLTAGRHYSPHFFTLATYGLGGGFGWGNATTYFEDASVLRMNNSLSYVSPVLSGFSARVAYGLGENQNGQSRVGDVANIAAQYDIGRFSMQLSHLSRKTTAVNTEKWSTLGVSYDFGMVKTAAIYRTRRDDANVAKNDVYEVSALVPVGTGSLLLDYGAIRNKVIGDADAQALNVRYDHPLSKRTSLYTGIAKIRNDINSRYGVNGATGAALTAANGDDVRSVIFGVRHLF